MEDSWNIWGSSGWPYHVSLSRGFQNSLRMDGKHPFQRWWASWREVWTSGGISTDAPYVFQWRKCTVRHIQSLSSIWIYITYLTSMHHYASIYPCNSFRLCSISTYTCTYNSISNCCEMEQFSQISGFCWPFWCRIMANVASPKLMVSDSYWLPTPWAMFDVFSVVNVQRKKERERERARARDKKRESAR